MTSHSVDSDARQWSAVALRRPRRPSVERRHHLVMPRRLRRPSAECRHARPTLTPVSGPPSCPVDSSTHQWPSVMPRRLLHPSVALRHAPSTQTPVSGPPSRPADSSSAAAAAARQTAVERRVVAQRRVQPPLQIEDEAAQLRALQVDDGVREPLGQAPDRHRVVGERRLKQHNK